MDRRKLKIKSSLHNFPSLSSQLSSNDSNSENTSLRTIRKRKISNTDLLISGNRSNTDLGLSSDTTITKKQRSNTDILESMSTSVQQREVKKLNEKQALQNVTTTRSLNLPIDDNDVPLASRISGSNRSFRTASDDSPAKRSKAKNDKKQLASKYDELSQIIDDDIAPSNQKTTSGKKRYSEVVTPISSKFSKTIDNDDTSRTHQKTKKDEQDTSSALPASVINNSDSDDDDNDIPIIHRKEKAKKKIIRDDDIDSDIPLNRRRKGSSKKQISDVIEPNVSSHSIISDDVDAHSTQQNAKKDKRQAVDVTNVNLSSTEAAVNVHKNSPEKNKRTQVPNPERQTIRKKSKFCKFLKDCGIVLKSDNQYKLDNNLMTIKKRMKEILYSGKYNKAEVIKFLEEYVGDDENLQTILTNVEPHTDYESFNEINNLSVVRILLQITELQTDTCDCLLHKLNDAILCSDSTERLVWARTILQQFRFLEVIVDPDALNNNLEQLLESCPTWFQKEIMSFIPDIVTDTHYHKIADILSKLLEESPDLTASILNCISSLTLGQQYLEDYKDKMLNLLKRNLEISLIPDILKFLFSNSVNLESSKEILKVLRCIEMQPLGGETPENCFKHQMRTINLLRMNLLSSKDIVQAAISVIKEVTKEPKPLDLILLLLISSTSSTRRKNVEQIIKNNVQYGIYRSSILHVLYNDYKEVIKSLQAEVLSIACTLLKAEEHAFVEFTSEWFRLMFLSQENTIYKQREIVEKIIVLIGNNNQSAKNALNVLRKMVTKEDEKLCLQNHSNHLRILLEKMDNLDLEEVGMLNDLLHGLCTNTSSVSELLRNDLFILLQKQLSNTKPLTKCKGVLGAIMAIKYLAQELETCKTANNLFHKVLAAVKNCPRSHSLFYDQLSQIISQTANIQAEFLRNITSYVEEEFVSTHMVDFSEYKGELVPKFGLNDTEEEGENCVISFENKKFGAIVPITFKLIKTCNIRLSESGNLEAVDALLGSAVLMPEDLDIPEPMTLDLIICCINWFRELISGFVTQTDQLLQNQVLKRLDALMKLQEELNMLLTMCDAKYQPTPCYFHYFPTPTFVKVEKKPSKKGKKKSAEKSTTNTRNEAEDSSSMLYAKNPAYFRRFDAKIACLLDINMEVHTVSQNVPRTITTTQVCFVVKELLAMFENEPDESFLIDIIHLLPKICTKLQDVVTELREEDNSVNREAVRLLLHLITMIFNWKGFDSVTYNPMLRDGLRTLAGLINKSNAMLRSCKELVTESCKYIESLCDIATRIPVATTLVDVCRSLMKHSETYTKQHKGEHAKMAFGFLSLVWPGDKQTGPLYKAAINALLNHWIDNEPLPLETITALLDWLPDEVDKLEKPQDTLTRLPSINKNHFHILYKKTFDGVIKGAKIAISSADSDPRRIEVWQTVASCIQKITQICKTMKTKANILIFLRYMPLMLKLFLNLGMPVLEHNLKYQTEKVTKILKIVQGSTRHLHAICCDCTERKDIVLTKHVPAAKAILERLLYSVKGMLVLNNSTTAFWMGNLVNKDLDGMEILSQASSEETTIREAVPDDVTNESSEILGSELDYDSGDEHSIPNPSEDENDE